MSTAFMRYICGCSDDPKHAVISFDGENSKLSQTPQASTIDPSRAVAHYVSEPHLSDLFTHMTLYILVILTHKPTPTPSSR